MDGWFFWTIAEEEISTIRSRRDAVMLSQNVFFMRYIPP